ncbi:MAG: cardiolipin synthase [Prevotella sp.]|nr:cardiolipin synthase [Prevotella sp.]
MVSWLIILIYFVIIIGAMLAVLMDNRPPAKTMAWMLVLFFVPIIGIILYFFFGQNTRREHIISQRSLDQLSQRSMLEFVDQKEFEVPERYRSLVSLFNGQSMALPFQNNAVEVYTDGGSFFDALHVAIMQARHHIHLLTYIIEDDTVGRRVVEALISKAQQGVEVRLLYDDVGCWKVKSSFFEQLREGGIEVHSFMPVKFPAFTSKVNYRNHRKICVIDGSIGFIGGMNIAERYLSWRDTHLKVVGSVVNDLQRAFLVDWYFVDRTLINGKEYYGAPLQLPPSGGSVQSSTASMKASPMGGGFEGGLMQVVTSSPTSPWPEIEQGYVKILLEAQRYVYMETPYFLPTESVLFAMRAAAVAGVDVRLVIPMKNDSRLLEWASRSYVMATIEAGVKVYFYKPRFIHSKLLVCDDALASVGSANIDFRSFENNFEANMFIYDGKIATEIKQVFLDDLAQSILLDDIADMQNRPFVKRLWESVVRLLAPLL